MSENSCQFPEKTQSNPATELALTLVSAVELLVRRDAVEASGSPQTPETDFNEALQLHSKFLKSAGTLVRTFGHQLIAEGLVYVRHYSSASQDFVCLASQRGWDEVYQVAGEVTAFQVTEKYVAVGLASGGVGVFERNQSLTTAQWQALGVESPLFQGVNFRSAQIRLGRRFTALSQLPNTHIEKIEVLRIRSNKIFAVDSRLKLVEVAMSLDDSGRVTLGSPVVSRIGGIDSAVLGRSNLIFPSVCEGPEAVLGINTQLYSLALAKSSAHPLCDSKEEISCITFLGTGETELVLGGQSGGGVVAGVRGSVATVPLISEKISSRVVAVVPLLEEVGGGGTTKKPSLSALAVVEEEAKVHIFEPMDDGSFQLKSSIRVLEHLRASLGSSETDLDSQSIRLLSHRSTKKVRRSFGKPLPGGAVRQVETPLPQVQVNSPV